MPNATVLEQKQKFVADLADKMKTYTAGVLVDYHRINVSDDTKLRADLRKNGVEYSVIKNTLISKACDLSGFDDIKQHLNGMTAVAISKEDPIVAAKILNDFAEKNENFSIKAGFLDGEYLSASAVKELASTPSKEAMIGRILGSVQGSLYGFVYALQAIIEKSGEVTDAPADAAPAAEAAQ